MAVVANPLVVRIFINSTLTGRENGWAERWPILETNWNLALPVALEMVQARQRVLSSNAYIQWACLGTVEPPYYEQTVVTDPLEPLPQWGPAAFDMQGILFDFNTTAGENAPRLFRAIEGTSIIAKRWFYADMPVPWAPPPLPANLATAPKDLLWQNTLATFRQYAATQQPMEDGNHGDGEGYWVDAFSQAVYREVRSRRWGRPWKRMSWESAPFVNAPQFSPCGCVVTVNRISYAIQCRFGPGWQLRWIHYYESQPGATVMTFKTPFCCWNRSLEYTDFSGVGEAKKFQRRNWTNGVEWGNAPGVMWTGPQSYFEGFAPEPPIPTPGFMRPACDDPVAPPGQIAPGGAGAGGTGILAPVSFTLERTGGAGAGGLADLIGVIDRGGAGAGGLVNLIGLREQSGGAAAAGRADLVGVAGGADGGAGVGGVEDVPQQRELAGGLGLGGAVNLVGLIDAAGGAGMGGKSDPLSVPELAGGLALGGAANLPGLLELVGGVGAGGSEDLPHSTPILVQKGDAFNLGGFSTNAFFGASTAGNLLVVCIGKLGGGTITAPAGWILLASQGNPGATADVSIYYYPNAPSMGTVNFAFSSNSPENGITYYEIGNADPVSPADQSATNSGTSNTVDSGTTAATTAVYEFACAIMFEDPTDNATVPYTNGYIDVSTNKCQTAYKLLTATGAQNTSIVLVSGSAGWCGAIGTFKGA